MAVTVHLLASPLRGLVDNRPALELPHVAGETIAELLERLFDAYPALRRETLDEHGRLLYEYQVWYREEMVRDDGFERRLDDGDVLAFLLPIAGGAVQTRVPADRARVYSRRDESHPPQSAA